MCIARRIGRGIADLRLSQFRQGEKGTHRAGKVLAIMRDGGSFPLTFKGRNGKVFADLFHWLYVPSTGDNDADTQAALNKIVDFARSGAPFPG
jgi:hypothetical protein